LEHHQRIDIALERGTRRAVQAGAAEDHRGDTGVVDRASVGLVDAARPDVDDAPLAWLTRRVRAERREPPVPRPVIGGTGGGGGGGGRRSLPQECEAPPLRSAAAAVQPGCSDARRTSVTQSSRVAAPGGLSESIGVTMSTPSGVAVPSGGKASGDVTASGGVEAASAVAPPSQGKVTPREAAFLLALLTTSAAWSSRREPGNGAREIAARIAMASPADCLDAAFAAVPKTSPKELIRRFRATATRPSVRPFFDVGF
jgi:hypothetical protein